MCVFTAHIGQMVVNGGGGRGHRDGQYVTTRAHCGYFVHVLHENFWVPLFSNEFELDGSDVTEALLTLQVVMFLHVRFCLTLPRVTRVSKTARGCGQFPGVVSSSLRTIKR